MLTVLGILLLVAGAILTFAVDRQADGVDLQAVGWILLGGGGLALLAAMIRAAALVSVEQPAAARPVASSRAGDEVRRASDEGSLTIEERRVA